MRLRTAVAIASGVAGALVAVPAWYLARRLNHEGFRPERDRDRFTLDLQVTAISDQTVTLRNAGKAPYVASDADGHYLLAAARGYGYAGRVLESNGVISVREYRPGTGDIRSGDYARLDPYAHPGDPYEAHGLPFEDVEISSPAGTFPAWYVRGRSNTWAILVHGKGADRRESLRLLPILAEAGFHCLVISYRNDLDCSPAASGRYSYGRDEWEELDAAAAYALGEGATDLVVCGYSMGGAISLSFMANSRHAGAVSALILDAPMWHLEDCVTHGARAARLPVRMLSLSNRVAARRYGFRWEDFDYLRTLPSLTAPVLLFHGDADKTIPVELSDSAAAMRPDLITYVRLPGAGHVRAWNVGPSAYRDTVLEFVRTRRQVPSS